MSSQAAISRRALFGFLRKKEEPAPSPEPARAPAPVPAPAAAPGGGFSLEAFYSSRSQAGEATGNSLPVFSLREGLVVPQDGVSRIGMAPPAPPGGGPSSVSPGAPTGAPVPGMTVRVRPQLCLAWQGSFCSTCSERCPVENAIVIELGRPRVVEDRCNGCGVCVQVCPAPLNAFEFLPSRQQVPVS
ncbi:4Fe-4S binding protein [Archangium sp.]|uniref:4Fe-4S binding protein n=1 Tax=Archangium sp. TaxID=1872627 RepID=UPI002ED844C9